MDLQNKKFKNIYEPAEDSKLLLKYSKKELDKSSNKNILEVGIGSGFCISNLQKNFPKNKYFGTDINPFAIELVKEENRNINLKKGNLFNSFKNLKFDLILFNTPYFPVEDGEKFEDLTLKDRAIYGGEKGWETIEEFIIESKKYLKKNAKVIMIFSSLSNFDQIKKILEENLFSYEILEEENSFFEKIYCLKFYPLKILTQLKNKKISNIKFLAKGKHSIVLDGEFESKNIIIKIGLEKDIQIENKFLTQLKKEFFIPQLFFSEKTFCVREKLEGQNIKDFLIEEINKEKIIKVLNKIFEITNKLDELKINKQEMTNPYKHIFIDSNLDVKMIDFERCLFTNKPKNTTQFLQYIRRNINLLKEKEIFIDEKKIFKISKKYKISQINKESKNNSTKSDLIKIKNLSF